MQRQETVGPARATPKHISTSKSSSGINLLDSADQQRRMMQRPNTSGISKVSQSAELTQAQAQQLMMRQSIA